MARDTLERDRLVNNLIDRLERLEKEIRSGNVAYRLTDTEKRLVQLEASVKQLVSGPAEVLIPHLSTNDDYRLYMDYDADVEGALLIAESTTASTTVVTGDET